MKYRRPAPSEVLRLAANGLFKIPAIWLKLLKNKQMAELPKKKFLQSVAEALKPSQMKSLCKVMSICVKLAQVEPSLQKLHRATTIVRAALFSAPQD